MAYEIEEINPLTKKAIVKVPLEKVNKLMNVKLRAIQKTAKIHGFRKGKVPMSVLKERFGGSAFNEALQETCEKLTNEVLGEQKDVVYLGQREVNVEDDGNFVASFVFETLPTLDPVGYLGIELQTPKIEVTQEDIDQTLETLQKNNAVYEPVEERSEIQLGDYLVISYHPISKTVSEIDDEKLTANGVNIRIPETEDDLTDIDKALVGSSKDDTITVVAKLKDLGFSQYGPDQSCTLEIDVHAINKEILPEIDDELAKEANFETLQELTEKIRENLTQTKEENKSGALRRLLLHKLNELFPIELPENFVKSEIDQAIRNSFAQFGHPSPWEVNLDEFPNIDQIREEASHETVPTLRFRFIAKRIGEIENIQITREDISKRMIQEFSNARVDREQASRLMKDQNFTNYITDQTFLEKALDFIIENAEKTEIDSEKFYEELMELDKKLHPHHDHDHDHEHDHDHSEESEKKEDE